MNSPVMRRDDRKPAADHRFSNKRILIVDDNPAILQDFRKILAPAADIETKLMEGEVALFGNASDSFPSASYELEFASQGLDAINLVRQSVEEGRPFALAFVDVRMPPGLDGIETVARFWQIDPLLQVSFCTAYSDYCWREISNHLSQPDSFVILKKPFEVIEVLQIASAFTAKWSSLHSMHSHSRALQESQERYRFLVDSIPTSVWTARPDGTVDFVNRWLQESTGASAEELLESDLETIIHMDDVAAAKQSWASACGSGERFQVEYRFRNAKDRQYYWHLGRAVPMRDAAGKIVQWFGTAVDIEAQKQVLEVLRQSQVQLENRVNERTRELQNAREQFERLLRSSPTITYSASIAQGFRTTYVSENVSALLGHEPDAFLDNADFWLAQVHPDHVPQVKSMWNAVVTSLAGPIEYRFRHKDGSYRWVRDDARVLRNDAGEPFEMIGSLVDVTERRQFESAIAYERDLLRTLMENSPDFIYFKDRESRFLRCSKTLAARFGIRQPEDVIGRSDFEFYAEPHARAAYEDEQEVIRTGEPLVGKVEEERLKGSETVFWALTSKLPLRDDKGNVIGTFGISKDITAIKEAEQARQGMELQLRQAQKLEAIGQLAAGIAHEINTPTQYVGDNTRFLEDSFSSIVEIFGAYEAMLHAAKSHSVTPEVIARVEQARKAADLDYLFKEIPAALRETLEGVERVTKIVRAMKEFSHPGGNEKSGADLNKAIETTVTVARNEWKYVSDMVLNLDPALPHVPCLIGEFNQVMLNLIVNAAHAVADVTAKEPGTKGKITIETRCAGDFAEIRVSDTGTGIPEEIQRKIFEPFFTTKGVGKGSGQGLSIVYGSVVKKHGGSVGFETQMGRGTTFIVRLPLTASGESLVAPPRQASAPIEDVNGEPAQVG